ncbi:hypothetical protein Bpfe_027952, partial [Biomphalaria pfeifferi]
SSSTDDGDLFNEIVLASGEQEADGATLEGMQIKETSMGEYRGQGTYLTRVPYEGPIGFTGAQVRTTAA